jgi:predicted DNA-binding protein
MRKQQEVKAYTIGVRLDLEVLHRLDAAAAREDRTVSNLVRVILTKWLAEHEPKEVAA